LLVVEGAGPGRLALAGGLPVTPVPEALARAGPGDVVLVRPGQVRVGQETGGPSWPARVLGVSYRGGHAMVELLVGRARLLAAVGAGAQLQDQQDVSVSVPAEAFHLLPHADPPGLAS
jgi:hypothetical protein